MLWLGSALLRTKNCSWRRDFCLLLRSWNRRNVNFIHIGLDTAGCIRDTKKRRLMYIDASLYINPFPSGVPRTLQWVVSLMKTAVCFAASSQLWLGVGDEKHFNFNQWEQRLSNKWPIGCRIDSLSIPSRNIFDNSIIYGFLNMSISPFWYWLSGESRSPSQLFYTFMSINRCVYVTSVS